MDERTDYIRSTISTIDNILKEKLCNSAKLKLEEYRKFLKYSIGHSLSLEEIRDRMLGKVRKAIHIESFESPFAFYFFLSAFFNRIYEYISTYNSIKKKRKLDKATYKEFCETIFTGETPCIELTYELISAMYPVESLEYEGNEKELEFNVKLYGESIERAKRSLRGKDHVLRRIVEIYREFLCNVLDVECDAGEYRFEYYFTPHYFFNFLYAFGFIDEFEELQDVFTIEDLNDILRKEHIGFIKGEDYALKKACCL